MNMTDIRVALYVIVPVAAVLLPWVSFDDATGLVTVQFTIDGLMVSLGTAGVAVAGIYRKWGKR